MSVKTQQFFQESLYEITPKIIKCPYEEGAYWRKGAKQGPDAIIEEALKIHGFSLGMKQYSSYKFKDLIHPSVYLPVYSKIEALKCIKNIIQNVLELGYAPVCLGGDHSVTLPIIRALTTVYGKKKFGLIQFDAHSDTFDDVDGFQYHHGSFVRHVVDEGLIEAENIIQLGVRGFVKDKGLKYADNVGIKYFSVKEISQVDFDLSKVISDVNIPYYISIDIDAIDPAFAPGTGTPVPGGFTSQEMLIMLNQLFQLNVIGLDIMEVAPIYDSSNITSLLAAHILCESLIGMSFKGIKKEGTL